jgi:hypothetical protein
MTKGDGENRFRSEFIHAKTVIFKERGLSKIPLTNPGEQAIRQRRRNGKRRNGETEKGCNIDVA